MKRPLPRRTLFPYTTLCRSNAQLADHQKVRRAVIWPEPELPRTEGTRKLKRAAIREWVMSGGVPRHVQRDRKSTRLNSSHSQISYAVFCLKKKIFMILH